MPGMSIPKDLDPNTLRWVAMDMDVQIREAEEIIADIDKRHARDGVIPSWRAEAREGWVWIRDRARSNRFRLRNIATRLENRKVRDPRA